MKFNLTITINSIIYLRPRNEHFVIIYSSSSGSKAVLYSSWPCEKDLQNVQAASTTQLKWMGIYTAKENAIKAPHK